MDWGAAASMGGGGVALALAFPRPDIHLLAWVALVPWLVVAVGRPPRVALGWGWLGGTLFFLGLLRWLDYTFRLYSAIPWPLTWLPILALAAYCGLYVGLVSAAVSWLSTRRGPGLALAAAPALWVLAEWARGQLFGGFPWGLIGYTQHAVLPVIQLAELTGVYGVSGLIVGVNSALATVLVLPRRRSAAAVLAAAAVAAIVVGFGLVRLRAPEAADETVSLAVIQPSIDQPLKWDPAHQAATLRTYLSLTERAMTERVDLVVWPETASPTVFRRDLRLQGYLRELTAAAGTPLLVGSIDVSDREPLQYYNSAFLLSARGIVARYDKMQLVPFGEYVPLSGVIGFVRGWAEFIAELEPGAAPVVFTGPPAAFGVVICYEGIFPELVRTFVRRGARFMVNMTNDAWFGRTSGPLQHLAMYPLRAVEHRIAIARAANTGVSAFVSPTGRITRQAGLYTREVLTDRLALRRGETVYSRFGDWFVGLCLAVAGGLTIGALRRGAERAQ